MEWLCITARQELLHDGAQRRRRHVCREMGAEEGNRASERLAQGEFDVFMQAQERIAEIMLPLSILSVIVNAVILGFIVGSLKTEPRTNKHGPVPGSEYDEFR